MINQLQPQIKDVLEKHFDFIKDKLVVVRSRRMHLELEQSQLFEVLMFVVKLLDFNFLCAITGLDDKDSFSFIYHLSNMEGIMLNLKIRTDRNKPVIQTVTNYFPSADIYERELIDLLGVEVEGLAPGMKYPLPDNWPQGEYPLRKDWKGGANA